MTGGDNKPFPLNCQPQQHSEHRGHQQRNPNEPPTMNSARMQKKNFAAHKFPSCSSISDSSSAASSTLPCHASHTTYRVEITVVHPINPRVIMLIKCLFTKCPTIIALDSKWTHVNNSNANCCSNYIILPILSTIKPHRQSHPCIHCDPNRCLCCCPSIYLCLYVQSTDHNPFGEKQ